MGTPTGHMLVKVSSISAPTVYAKLNADLILMRLLSFQIHPQKCVFTSSKDSNKNEMHALQMILNVIGVGDCLPSKEV